MNEKGILTKDDERWIAHRLDDVCKLKGWIELVDGHAFRALISVADNYLVENYVPETGKNLLKELVILGKAKDVEGIKTLINEHFKITNFLIISLEASALTFILNAVWTWAESIKED